MFRIFLYQGAVQKVILSSRVKRSDLNFELKTKDCFVVSLLAMTSKLLLGQPLNETQTQQSKLF